MSYLIKQISSLCSIGGMDEKTILERLDRIIAILQDIAKPPSLGQRIANGAAVGVGILGILTVVETIRSWLGG